jgi:hypothetical protein
MAFLVRMAFHGFRHFAAAGLGLPLCPLILLPLPALRCALIAKKAPVHLFHGCKAQRGRERGRRMSLFLFCCCRPSTSAEASAAAAALFLPRSSLRYHLSHPLPQPQNSKPKTPAASRAASPARPARATLATSSSPFRCTTPWSSGEGRLTSSSSSSSSALFFPPRRVSSSTLALSAHFSLLSFSSSLSMRTAGLFTSSSSPPASTASGSA